MLKSRRFLLVLAAHIVVLVAAMPASPWEFDEPLFFQALHDYDPLAHHPPPPGYPLFILFGQLVRLVIPSDFATLITISVLGSVAGFVMLALAFRNLADDELTGVTGAALFYFSPGMLIHSTLPISEPWALALLAAALYFMTRPGSAPVLFALFAALTVGWRIQFAIFIVPLFLAALVMMRRWRDRAIALAVFTITCVAWLIPLAMAVGGLPELIAFETGQGQYLASQDAGESRTGWTAPRIAFRFIARAWGTEWMALGVLAIASLGFVLIVRSRLRRFAPLGAGAAIYIAFALRVMDPADGVRYAIPFVLATAYLLGVGMVAIARRLSLPPYVLPTVAAVVFLVYVGPLLMQRRLTISPPVRAAAYAREAFPANAVVLYELPLWPHTMYYLGDRNPHRVDDGLARFYDHPDVPLFIYADGATTRPDARVFAWKSSDAYVKLTRNHYRAASIIPVLPERRFRIISGIYAPEREQDGLEWRWLDAQAELQLPRAAARSLTIRLGIPAAAPLDTNRVTVFVDGEVAGQVQLERASPGSVTVAVPAGAPTIRLESERTFVPADVPEMRSGDRRRLAIELYDLETAPRRESPD